MLVSYEAAPHERKANDHGYIVIVFSAFAVESHINDYGARRLTDGYFSKHLDNLKTIDKWLIIPRLITGKQFPKDQHAFQ